jgi:sterol 3beta-glucosyltransferase
MKVAALAYGTRGDVQPIVCLGRALADEGHEVEVIAPRDGAGMVGAAGLPFRALPCDFQSLLRAPQAQRMLAAGNINAMTRWFRKEEKRYEAELHQTLLAATDSVDLVVSTVVLAARCRAIAEARRIAFMPIYLTPHVSSRTYASIFVTQRNLGALNRLSHALAHHVIWRAQRDPLAALHRELGLPPPTRRDWSRAFVGEGPALLAYSEALFPTPHDWPEWLQAVGFFKPSSDLRAQIGASGIPPELEDWLAAGPPPVFLGFGSMPVLDERAMLRTVREALAALGVRGILAAGWSELDAAGDETLYVVDEVDHVSLLPRCAAAVHHGGAGTIAASAGAGLPTLVCSVWWDQPFWGARCRKLGIGDTFPFARLDTRRLVDGLRAVLEPEVAKRARELARRMDEEDGVADALARLEDGKPFSGGPVPRRS